VNNSKNLTVYSSRQKCSEMNDIFGVNDLGELGLLQQHGDQLRWPDAPPTFARRVDPTAVLSDAEFKRNFRFNKNQVVDLANMLQVRYLYKVGCTGNIRRGLPSFWCRRFGSSLPPPPSRQLAKAALYFYQRE
jgi:hypothetical protein